MMPWASRKGIILLAASSEEKSEKRDAAWKSTKKHEIARASGVSSKTIERSAYNLLLALLGVDANEVEKDPGAKAYLHHLLYGDEEITVEEESSET